MLKSSTDSHCLWRDDYFISKESLLKFWLVDQECRIYYIFARTFKLVGPHTQLLAAVGLRTHNHPNCTCVHFMRVAHPRLLCYEVFAAGEFLTYDKRRFFWLFILLACLYVWVVWATLNVKIRLSESELLTRVLLFGTLEKDRHVVEYIGCTEK